MHVPYRLLLAIAALVPLAACGNAPQQPSDVVDDRSAESPYLGGGEDGSGVSSPDFRDLTGDTGASDRTADATDTSGLSAGGTTAGADAITTGSLPAKPADLSTVAGRWAPTEADCEVAGSTTTITSSRFESLERMCDISDAIGGGSDGSIALTLQCSRADGQSDSELVKLTPRSGHLDLHVVGGEEVPQTLTQCP